MINGCIYYNGEDECPYSQNTIRSTFWRIEKIWDKIVRDDEIERCNKESEFLCDFPDGMPGFNIQTSLKATLYNQFSRFGGDREGFSGYLQKYLTSNPK